MAETSHTLLPLALYPLIATQGLYVKYRAAQLDEAQGPRQGRTGAGPVLRLLVVGDSSAAGVGVDHIDEALPGQLAALLGRDFTVDWTLVARCGDTTARSLARLSDMPHLEVDVAVTALGVNDAKNGVPLRAWRMRTDALHATLVQRFGARLVVASGLPPVQDFPLLPDPLRSVLAQRCAQFDAALQDIAERRPQVSYLPGDIRLTPEVMAHDGFHPTAPVYADWAARAARIIRRSPVAQALSRPEASR